MNIKMENCPGFVLRVYNFALVLSNAHHFLLCGSVIKYVRKCFCSVSSGMLSYKLPICILSLM